MVGLNFKKKNQTTDLKNKNKIEKVCTLDRDAHIAMSTAR